MCLGQHMGEDNVVDIMSPLPQDPTKILAPKVSVTTRLLDARERLPLDARERLPSVTTSLLDATHMLAPKLSMAKALSEQ